MSEYIIVYSTFKNLGQAERIGKTLVEAGLAACANIMPEIRTIYKWKGKVEQGLEVPMMIKTRKKHFKKLEAEIKKLHNFEIPCIISWEIDKGSKEYLGWLKESTI
jgi:periplasmic divalent cation tolerance protein